MKKYKISEAGRVEIVEARMMMDAQRVALKMGFTLDADIDEVRREVTPEELAYEKYVCWKNNRYAGCLFREEIHWGEASDRDASASICPLTPGEMELARKWAKFTGDRTFPK